MDPRLLSYYNRELHHLREMGTEFAKEFPKVAGRLGLEGFECADPYVERLLEGFAFLAARVQLKIDAEFPRFTQHLLESVYPHYLAPTPSMAVVHLQPDLSEGGLAEGFVIPRDSVLRSLIGKGDKTACEYRTAHEVTLWPLELVEAEYHATPATLASLGLPDLGQAKAGVRLRLRTSAGLTFDKLSLQSLPLYLRGSEELPMRLYEQLVGNSLGMVVRPGEGQPSWHERVDRSGIRRLGFDDHEALLPYGPRSFQGYRLVYEYFAFPERYLFVELAGLGPAVRRCTGSELEVMVLLGRSDPALEQVLDASHFSLFCSPAINLFPKRADRIHLTHRQHEYHVVPDRTRAMDFEVYAVRGVTGHGTGARGEQAFRALYALDDSTDQGRQRAYYTVQREQRVLSSRQRRQGPRSSYLGSEVFVSLVDADEAPYDTELRQLSVDTLCTNRDLPLELPVGRDKTDFTLESGAPVASVRCVSGPTKPQPSWAKGDATWRLISHLSLNYLSLTDSDAHQGAAALRALLTLYGDVAEAPIRRQIEGVKSVTSRPVVQRMPLPGPISFGRGLEVTVTCEQAAFEGTGMFLLGAVLAEFFRRYVSINTFTETVLRTPERGEVMRWPARMGRCHTL